MHYASFLRVAAFASLALPALPSAAYAAGVPAGTLIENTASASYNTGGPPQSLNSNTVAIKVDELLDVAVASKDAAAIAISGSAVLSFTVTNTGNGPEAFKLTADPNVAGNAFNATVTSLAFDTNGNGVYDPGVDSLLANGAASPSIASDAALTVFVLVSASGAADGTTSQVNLLARAATGTGAPGTVFAGAGDGGGAAVVGSTGADDQARGSLVANAVSVALVKTAVVRDPFGGTQPVPGARITFRIAASVSGTGAVNGLIVTDAIPTSTTYAAGSLALDGAGLTDLADADAGTASSAGVAVNLGTAGAGLTRVVTFDVIVN